MTADFSELWRPFVSLRFVSPVQAIMPTSRTATACLGKGAPWGDKGKL